MSLERWLNGIWYEGRSGALALAPLSAIHALLAGARRIAYGARLLPRGRVAARVIVVGNITVGGTGKTPLVIWLARALLQRGRRVGVLCRGHGGRHPGPREVRADSDAVEVGDEALLLAEALPGVRVVASRVRLVGARQLAAHGAEIVICDDGLQHLALERDVEIAVVDAQRGLGNGRLLPAGPLRERGSRLASVDLVVENLGDGSGPRQSWRSAIPGLARTLTMRTRPGRVRALGGLRRGGSDDDRSPDEDAERALESFAGAPVHAVAGIGAPERFFGALERAGLRIHRHAFPDHHAYVATDLAFGDALPILMTGKDAVKCRAFGLPHCWEVSLHCELSSDDAETLLALCDPRPASPAERSTHTDGA